MYQGSLNLATIQVNKCICHNCSEVNEIAKWKVCGSNDGGIIIVYFKTTQSATISDLQRYIYLDLSYTHCTWEKIKSE